MTAEIFRLWDYRKPEDASACETRLFLMELRKESGPYPLGREPVIELTEQQVNSLADMKLEGVKILAQGLDTAPCELIAHYMAPDKDPA